jgi:hypothetical protein
LAEPKQILALYLSVASPATNLAVSIDKACFTTRKSRLDARLEMKALLRGRPLQGFE